ncbi:hypothetical protein MRX96_033865 [Rhipicephalus microplus]
MADTTVAAAAAAASTAKSFCIEALLARDSGRATPASKSPGSCSEGDAASPPPSSIPVSVAAVVASQAAGRLLGAIPGYHPVLQAGTPVVRTSGCRWWSACRCAARTVARKCVSPDADRAWHQVACVVRLVGQDCGLLPATG